MNDNAMMQGLAWAYAIRGLRENELAILNRITPEETKNLLFPGLRAKLLAFEAGWAAHRDFRPIQAGNENDLKSAPPVNSLSITQVSEQGRPPSTEQGGRAPEKTGENPVPGTISTDQAAYHFPDIIMEGPDMGRCTKCGKHYLDSTVHGMSEEALALAGSTAQSAETIAALNKARAELPETFAVATQPARHADSELTAVVRNFVQRAPGLEQLRDDKGRSLGHLFRRMRALTDA